MIRKLISICVLILVVSCSVNDKEGSLVISGKVATPFKDFVFLEILTTDGYEKVDSSQLKDDHTFTLHAPKGKGDIYRINFFHKQKNTFVLGESDAYIEAEGNSDLGRFYIKGSHDLDVFSQLSELKIEHWLNRNVLNQQIRVAKGKNDHLKLDSLNEKLQLLDVQIKEDKVEVIRSVQGALARLFLLYDNFEIEPNLDMYNEQMPLLKSIIGDHWYFIKISELYHKLKELSVGAIPPDFNLPDPDGNMIKLSSFRGKYVFLDFWASWCQPCRIENPELVKVYEKFKGADFEILGVSLDKRKDRWLKAIEKDGLTWPHVSDLKYLNSKMVELYHIINVPTTYLLDAEGRIIAKNIHASQLDALLEELL